MLNAVTIFAGQGVTYFTLLVHSDIANMRYVRARKTRRVVYAMFFLTTGGLFEGSLNESSREGGAERRVHEHDGDHTPHHKVHPDSIL